MRSFSYLPRVFRSRDSAGIALARPIDPEQEETARVERLTSFIGGSRCLGMIRRCARSARFATCALLFATLLLSREGDAAEPLAASSCQGVYADDFSTLSSQSREFDRQPQSTFSYCTRNTATYECLSYAVDGAIHHERRKVVAHGTAFAYRKQGDDTLLLTNDHVASWPTVTDVQHVVDGVPAGCKKVSETLSLVDDEHDSYTRDDVALTRVVSDPQLDVAILKTTTKLQIMPWKVGHSARLRERNVVEVRGFPLGAFRATNAGTVVSAHDHDDYGDWDHDDFVVDALLSAGNSGSPVLAVSCSDGRIRAGRRLSRRVHGGQRAQCRHRHRSGARPHDDAEEGAARAPRRPSAARCERLAA